MGHARALLAISDPDLQIKAAEFVSRKGMSVRETEVYVNKLIKQQEEGVQEKGKYVKDQNLIEWENRIKEKIGVAKVQLQPGTNGTGKLIMSYKNDQELEKLMSFLNKENSGI
jgi:ParB family chromosome partitioning protein